VRGGSKQRERNSSSEKRNKRKKRASWKGGVQMIGKHASKHLLRKRTCSGGEIFLLLRRSQNRLKERHAGERERDASRGSTTGRGRGALELVEETERREKSVFFSAN